jgi:hypothetical protein
VDARLRAEIDQTHAEARRDIEQYVKDAHVVLAKHGPVDAPLHVVKMLKAWVRTLSTEDAIDWLAGTAAFALVELARREVE